MVGQNAMELSYVVPELNTTSDPTVIEVPDTVAITAVP